MGRRSDTCTVFPGPYTQTLSNIISRRSYWKVLVRGLWTGGCHYCCIFDCGDFKWFMKTICGCDLDHQILCPYIACCFPCIIAVCPAITVGNILWDVGVAGYKCTKCTKNLCVKHCANGELRIVHPNEPMTEHAPVAQPGYRDRSYGQWLEDDTNASSEYHKVVCPLITVKMMNSIISFDSCFHRNRTARFLLLNHRPSPSIIIYPIQTSKFRKMKKKKAKFPIILSIELREMKRKK